MELYDMPNKSRVPKILPPSNSSNTLKENNDMFLRQEFPDKVVYIEKLGERKAWEPGMELPKNIKNMDSWMR